MSELKVTPVAATALIAFTAVGALSTPSVVRLAINQQGRADYRLPTAGAPLESIRVVLNQTISAPVGDLDYGTFTEADEAMLQFAASAGADEIDFAEFYLDDDE